MSDDIDDNECNDDFDENFDDDNDDDGDFVDDIANVSGEWFICSIDKTLVWTYAFV